MNGNEENTKRKHYSHHVYNNYIHKKQFGIIYRNKNTHLNQNPFNPHHFMELFLNKAFCTFVTLIITTASYKKI